MKVLLRMVSKSLGDTIAASPYFEKYRKTNDCEVTVSCNWRHLFENLYPEIRFVGLDQSDDGFDKVKVIRYDFGKPLQQCFSDELGLGEEVLRPKIHFDKTERPVKGRYVCIAIQSTAQCKYWNYPDGWNKLCAKLRKKNITPICIDKDESFGVEGFFNQIPYKAVNKTGMDSRLDGVRRYLEHCEFFIGVSSGLAWVAHAMGKHVVMISGVTKPWNEFQDDVTRIHDDSVCNGCFHTEDFDASNWFWCPKGKRFECTTSITPESVMDELKHLI